MTDSQAHDLLIKLGYRFEAEYGSFLLGSNLYGDGLEALRKITKRRRQWQQFGAKARLDCRASWASQEKTWMVKQ